MLILYLKRRSFWRKLLIAFWVAFAVTMGAGSAGKPDMEAAPVYIKMVAFTGGVLVSIFLITIVGLIVSAIRRKEDSFRKWLITLAISWPLFSVFASATRDIESNHSVDIHRLNLLGAIGVELIAVVSLSLLAIAIWKTDIWAKWFLISGILLIAKGAASLPFRLASQNFRLIDYLFSIWLLLIIPLAYVYAYRPFRLEAKGEYGKLMPIFEKTLRKRWLLRTSRFAAIYNIAGVHHKTGRFDRSLEWLDKLSDKKLSENLGTAYHILYAANLLMLNKDLDSAEEHLMTANRLKNSFACLLFCYLYLLKDDQIEARRMIDEYLSRPRQQGLVSIGIVTIVHDKAFVKTVSDFFLGYYYLRINEPGKAREHLLEASRCSYDNFYRAKAVELLKALQ
jgi:hypothetical protein